MADGEARVGRCRSIYKHNLCHLAARRSSLSGVRYRDDPAIFAWDLMNEPRCVGEHRHSCAWCWAA